MHGRRRAQNANMQIARLLCYCRSFLPPAPSFAQGSPSPPSCAADPGSLYRSKGLRTESEP